MHRKSHKISERGRFDRDLMSAPRRAHDEGARAARGQTRLQREHPGNGKYGGYHEEHENDRFVSAEERRRRSRSSRRDFDAWRSPLAHYEEEPDVRRYSEAAGRRHRRGRS